MCKNKKILSKNQLLDYLRNVGEGFLPLLIKLDETGRKATSQAERTIDALAEVSWNELRFLFVVETTLQFNPKSIQEAIKRIVTISDQLEVNPLILTPYLSDEQLRVLESQQVSGIDLCGNGVIIVPGRLLVSRTGNSNRYPSSSPIRNVYRGTSSLVARSFLIKPEYESSKSLMEEVAARGGEITFSTVSKVCTSLTDELIIERGRRGRATWLRMMQPEKLLKRLADNYEPPLVRQQFIGKWVLDEQSFEEILQPWMNDTVERVVRTGASSSACYATMAREPIVRYYCKDLTSLLQQLGDSALETDRFPNLQLMETDDPTVYFDIRDHFNASPLQSYLELNAGDKRERETATQIRQRILRDIDRSRNNP